MSQRVGHTGRTYLNHHSVRPWRRLRLKILERDGWICRIPQCKAAQWLADPPAKDRWFAEAALVWITGQTTTRAIWRDAPKQGGRFHPLSPTVDVNPPKSLGGDERNPAHLRAGHWLCNVSRGNGTRGRAQQRWTNSAPRVTSR